MIPVAFVCDSSFTLPWVFRDEHNVTAEKAWTAVKKRVVTLHVPSLWLWEVANVLLLSERRGRIKKGEVGSFLSLLEHFPLKVEQPSVASVVEDLPPLIRKHGLTAYDSAYLAMAKRNALPLATLDLALAKAARAEGITILGD